MMGFAVAETLATVHCRCALEMALRKITKRAGRQLIHHNDRGIQHCSQEYLAPLAAWHVQVSMPRTLTRWKTPRPNASMVF
jgi:putative transposase